MQTAQYGLFIYNYTRQDGSHFPTLLAREVYCLGDVYHVTHEPHQLKCKQNIRIKFELLLFKSQTFVPLLKKRD